MRLGCKLSRISDIGAIDVVLSRMSFFYYGIFLFFVWIQPSGAQAFERILQEQICALRIVKDNFNTSAIVDKDFGCRSLMLTTSKVSEDQGVQLKINGVDQGAAFIISIGTKFDDAWSLRDFAAIPPLTQAPKALEGQLAELIDLCPTSICHGKPYEKLMSDFALVEWRDDKFKDYPSLFVLYAIQLDGGAEVLVLTEHDKRHNDANYGGAKIINGIVYFMRTSY